MKNPLHLLSQSRFAQRAKKSTDASDVASETLVYKTNTEQRFPTFAQFQYLPKLLNTNERNVLWAGIALLLICSPILIVRGYFAVTELAPDYGGSFTEGLVGAPQYVNPVLSPLSDIDSDLAELVFSGIFSYNDNQELKTDLITNYVVSEDELTYSFFLKPDVKWHDGESLNADDVLFTISVIQDPLYQSPLQSALRGVATEKLDDYSFSLKLPEPYAPFLSTLTFGILPEHLWYDVPAQNVRLTELNIKPVGTGPYRFNSLIKDKAGNIKSFHLVRSENYYGEKPYLDEINYIFYPDTQTAIEALKTKKIEALSFIPKAAEEEILKQNADITFHTLRIPQYTAIFFNQKQSTILQDKMIRQVLTRAVDRGVIIQEVLGGAGEATFTPILPGYIGHNADVDTYAFNQAENLRILEEEGWHYPEVSEESEGVSVEENTESSEEVPDENTDNTESTTVDSSVELEEGTGTSGEVVVEEEINNFVPREFVPREKDGVKLEFTVSTVDLPEYKQTLELLQKNWQEIGVKVNVDLYSPEDIQKEIIKTRDYEALLFGEIVGNDPDPYPFWHSSQQEHPGLALSIFRDREVDQLLEEARQTTNEEERRLKYLHFQNNIINNVQAIFLYNPIYTYGVHNRIQGIHSQQYITVPSDRFAGTAEWYVHTDRKFKIK